MADRTSRARHRSACSPSTPLSVLAKSLTAVDARKGFVAAASTGMVISMAAAGSALAGPETPNTANAANEQSTVKTARTGDVVAEARMTLAANPVISAPDTPWTDGSVTQLTPTVAEEPSVPEPVARTNYARTYAPAAAPAPIAAAAPIATSAIGGSVVDIASRYQGTPYVYGGTNPSGFDCSGFVQYVYAQAGVGLPRTSYGQGDAGHVISAGQAQPGDIVYYGNHVGIYAGEGMMIHAPYPGQVVSEVPVYGNPSFVRVGN